MLGTWKPSSSSSASPIYRTNVQLDPPRRSMSGTKPSSPRMASLSDAELSGLSCPFLSFFLNIPAPACPCHRLHTTVPPQSSTSWKMIDETENTLNRMGDLFSGQICMSTWGTRGRAPARTIFFSFFLAAAPAHEASTEDGRLTAASRRLYPNFPRPGNYGAARTRRGYIPPYRC